ncbi:MAG: carboxylating nicotinate-nucleotide diphosphorylase [Candidatus Delongbacteria bacterium]|jgi:nicotinate-nucleotide pyrophosphorylase (carboxylating)|nr:carboxylating nicotinate-nucleotide diphosphorylase [Candidatus Delongbacteria bacterium]
MIYKEYLKEIIQLAKKEDLGEGDHTTKACFKNNENGNARIFAKEAGVLAGVEVAKAVFKAYDKNLKLETFLVDGDNIGPGDEILHISGNKNSILTAERPVLNFLQRMSGIATKTREYADAIQDTKAIVLDTRKTTPGMRLLEKEAVRIGGGKNHRFGLYDMIMLKDNHIDFAGGIDKAISLARKYLEENNLDIPVEIEVRNFEELEQVLKSEKIDRVMLDNFTVEDTKRAVQVVNNRIEVESSGGITLENLRAYAETGVDYISVGSLTHHIKSLDISLYVV